MAGRLSGFGGVILSSNIRSLYERGYFVMEFGKNAGVYSFKGELVSEVHLVSGDIYEIVIGSKKVRYDSKGDRWVNPT